VRGRKLKIEDKQSHIRQLLGCSPDEADTYVMGIWGLQHVEPEDDNTERDEFTAIGVPSFIKTWR